MRSMTNPKKSSKVENKSANGVPESWEKFLELAQKVVNVSKENVERVIEGEERKKRNRADPNDQ